MKRIVSEDLEKTWKLKYPAFYIVLEKKMPDITAVNDFKPTRVNGIFRPKYVPSTSQI
jgi:hypothetical protein